MIAENLAHLRSRIRKAAQRCNRKYQDITLIAVSKKKSDEDILQAYTAGQLAFGENYLQEAAAKINILPDDICWHFIGHLQRNKAKLAVSHFAVIETVDRLQLASLLNTHAAALKKTIKILIQVNIGEEQQKSGVSPAETATLLTQIKKMPHLQATGLMIIPPYCPDPDDARLFFIKARQLSRQLADKGLFYDNNKVDLSMGMSHDFEVAIEEGATIIRVGTALFGARTY
ncbi:MAG: YggS family pyridoxal phosphate-dependent enzyme [Desulfobulbus propionicus]|nr:MAG: YggS family pyridoxal phosphate-dependent enzyme [Desulfobulbus propionicus]